MNAPKFPSGTKVRIDDQAGTVIAVKSDDLMVFFYDVRYNEMGLLIADGVPEDDLEEWTDNDGDE